MTGMFATACRYPLASRDARDRVAVASGLVIAVLVLVRVARALWPAPLALAPVAIASVPAVLFAGIVGSVLRAGADGDPELPRFGLSTLPVRTGVALVAVATVYLVGPAAILLGTVALLREAAGSVDRVGVTLAGTTALLVALGLAYALPAGVAVAVRDGVRAGLRVRSLPGLRHGAYFTAWVGAVVLVVLGWSVLAAAGTGSLLAVVAAVWFAYAHLAAARLVRAGLGRAAGWTGDRN